MLNKEGASLPKKPGLVSLGPPGFLGQTLFWVFLKPYGLNTNLCTYTLTASAPWRKAGHWIRGNICRKKSANKVSKLLGPSRTVYE